MQLNTVSETNRGQFEDREYSTEMIYSGSDQDYECVGCEDTTGGDTRHDESEEKECVRHQQLVKNIFKSDSED